jgi:hypothetical protein
MTDTPELYAAIDAAMEAVDITWNGDIRAFSRALIGKLIESLEEPAMPPVVAVQLMGLNAFSLGCKRTIAQLKRLAGIEELV